MRYAEIVAALQAMTGERDLARAECQLAEAQRDNHERAIVEYRSLVDSHERAAEEYRGLIALLESENAELSRNCDSLTAALENVLN